MEKISKDGFNIKKYIPAAALTILTVGLIFFFKGQTGEMIISDGREELLDFYTANLQPLVNNTDITKEDMFNFAIYKNIPIDKRKKNVLQLGSNNSGQEYFEIMPSVYNPNTSNYEKFKDYFALNDRQEIEIDSILNIYRYQLKPTLLSDEKDHLAVNQKISIIRKALLTELLDYTHRIDNEKWSKFVNWKLDPARLPEARQLTQLLSEDSTPEYIVFTPDTVISRELYFEKMESPPDVEALAEAEHEFIKITAGPETPEKIKIIEEAKNRHQNSGDYYYDRAFVTPFHISMSKEERDSLTECIHIAEESIRDFHYSFGVDTMGNTFSFEFSANEGDSILSAGFEMNLNEIETLIETSIGAAMSEGAEGWIEFGMKMDSLARVYETMEFDSTFGLNDSLYNFDPEQLKKELIKKKKNKSK